MSQIRIIIEVALIGVGLSSRLAAQPASYAYRPATYDGVAGVSQYLEIFPLDGAAFQISLPFELGYVTYSGDGRAIYANYLHWALEELQGRPGRQGIFKIEFNPTRVSHIPGSDHVGMAA